MTPCPKIQKQHTCVNDFQLKKKLVKRNPNVDFITFSESNIAPENAWLED